MTYQSLVPKVAAAFGIECDSIGLPQKGYRNESYKLGLSSGEEVNLIFHKNEPGALVRIRAADQASTALNRAGLPVRIRFDDRILRISDGKNEMYAGLYTYLSGATIPWEAFTKNHIKLLGWAMSDLHAVWATCEGTVPLHIAGELRDLLARMERYFDSPGVKQALEEKLGLSLTTKFMAFESLLDKLDRTTGVDDHILHMDLVRGNVLFGHSDVSPWSLDDVEISGIIDFEKAAMGHPVYDIARTLAFLLVDCANKDCRSIFKYFLQSGYNKRGGGSFKINDTIAGMPAHGVLNLLVSFFLLHDFYKFLKHTPYESLKENHHFLRTRDILIDYGMIRLNKD